VVRAREDPARYELGEHLLAHLKSHLFNQAIRIRDIQQLHAVMIKEDFDGSVPSFVACRLVHGRIATGDIGVNVKPIVANPRDAVSEFLLLRATGVLLESLI
jgi:hypothetical protein